MDQVFSRLRSVNPLYFQLVFATLGLGAIVVGILVWYSNQNKVDVQIISDDSKPTISITKVLVDVQGAVVKPGVYELSGDPRIKDALIAAGGLSDNADRTVFAKTVNLAQKLSDGAKIYIPVHGDTPTLPPPKLGGGAQSVKGVLVSINNASLNDLDALPGVGTVRAQAIIDGRPYTKVEELTERKVIPASVFTKIKDLISLY